MPAAPQSEKSASLCGVLAAPGIPEMLLAGREREFLGQFAFPAMSANPVRSIALEGGVGHYPALEAPDQVAHALLDFFSTVDAT
jgi:pimeloyl-ACP methyl ester carboxylesterase